MNRPLGHYNPDQAPDPLVVATFVVPQDTYHAAAKEPAYNDPEHPVTLLPDDADGSMEFVVEGCFPQIGDRSIAPELYGNLVCRRLVFNNDHSAQPPAEQRDVMSVLAIPGRAPAVRRAARMVLGLPNDLYVVKFIAAMQVGRHGYGEAAA